MGLRADCADEIVMPGESDVCAPNHRNGHRARKTLLRHLCGTSAQKSTQIKMQGLGYLAQYSTIAANEFGSSDAPPTSAPSISACAINADTLSGLTDPPYRMRRLPANSSPKISPACWRMTACASAAISGVAVFPVPMAQTGS